MTDPIAPAAPAAGQGEAGAQITSSPAPGSMPIPASATDWLTGLSDDVAGYVANKGWKAPADLLTSYQQLEKYVGAPADKLLRLPDFDKADKVEIDQFFTKLGRPSDPKGYEIPVPDGMPTDFAEAAKLKFHELGLSAKQAKALAEWNNEYGAQIQTKVTEEFTQNITKQQAALRQEWGAAYDQNDMLAGKVIANSGLTEAQLQAMTKAIGFDAAMKAFANLGQKLGEHGYVDGEGTSSASVLTPAGAQARIKQLQSDKEWTSKYLAGNSQARMEMDRLQQMAYPT